MADGLGASDATAPSSKARTRRTPVAVAITAAVVIIGAVALAVTGNPLAESRPSAATCEKARLDAPDLSRPELNAYFEGNGCLWYIRQFEDQIAADDSDQTQQEGAGGRTVPPAPATPVGYDDYVSEISNAGETTPLDEDSYSQASDTVCGYGIDEMTAWMRQQVEAGVWPLESINSSLLNYGAVVRHACPSAVTAYTEAARRTVLAGPGTGTSTEQMPDNLKEKMFDECMRLSETTPEALSVCDQYI